LSGLDARSTQRDPGKRRSHVRRWLTYLTLFLAASVLIGDVITVVYNLLDGEITTRFVLKVVTIGSIAGTIFGYYLTDLRLEDTKPVEMHPRSSRVFGGLTLAAVIIVIMGGVGMVGRPSVERTRRLDARRIDDLQRASRGTDIFWMRHKRLPATLDELAGEAGLAVSQRDPSGNAYGYRTTGARSYELCASFTTDSNSVREGAQPNFWSHRSGRQCFQLEAKENR
jgi:hypothetical protein